MVVQGFYFSTIEAFNLENERVTLEAKQEFDLDIYATPVVYGDGFFMQLCIGYEKFFSAQKLANVIIYVPNIENEIINL
jgi:hypothetical protein